jgi:gliding motility-associated-like protein
MIRLTVSYEDEDCKTEYTKNVVVSDGFTVDIQTDKSGSICEGETISLSIPGNFKSYTWSSGATSPSIQVSESGTYSVIVTTPEGCIGTGELEINFLLKPIVDVVAEDNVTSIGIGESIQLLAFGALNYNWFPVEGLDNAGISNPIARPTTTTTYKVIGAAANGCSVEKEITISVSNSINVNPRKIFSPNGDNIDDFWVVDRIQNYPDCTLSIFDRQGLMVFEKTGYNNDWTGTYNGKNLMQGVYFFVIRCGSKENQKTGSITLIR